MRALHAAESAKPIMVHPCTATFCAGTEQLAHDVSQLRFLEVWHVYCEMEMPGHCYWTSRFHAQLSLFVLVIRACEGREN
jgi:hypothetical protein